MQIPFLKPSISEEDVRLCVKSLESGWLAYGQYTELLEIKFSELFRSSDFVLTSSCTASLQMALVLSGVKPGDEIITTPLTWVATSNVALYLNAVPVFADVDEKTGLLSIENILSKVTERTKAIIAVDLYGQMFDYDQLRFELPRSDIMIVEDAAHAIGSTYKGNAPGSSADYACFSFHAAKNITAGQGGGLICRNKNDYAAARLLRRDGVTGSNQARKMVSFGYKFDSTDFQSALMLGQVERYTDTDRLRKKVYEKYTELFSNSDYCRFQETKSEAVHSGHMFVLWLNDPLTRGALVDFLYNRGVATSVHYNPVHLEPYYSRVHGFRIGDFPAAEAIGAAAVSLPTYPSLTLEEQEFIKYSVDEFYGGQM